MKKAILIAISILFFGFLLSLLTVNNTKAHIGSSYSVSVKALPFLHFYTETIEGYSDGSGPVSFCPEDTKITKGINVPVLNLGYEYSSEIIPYDGPCL